MTNMKLSLPKELRILLARGICVLCSYSEVIAAKDCFKTLHRQAISDAIEIAPAELKDILKSAGATCPLW